MKEANRILKYNLQLFAKDGPGGEKTEAATAKKIDDARKEGQVAKSKELSNGISLLALFFTLKIFLSFVGNKLVENFQIIFTRFTDIVGSGNSNFNTKMMHWIMNEMIIRILIILLPFLAIAVIVAFSTDLFQVKWKITSKPLEPKLDKMDPVKGFKRIFSMRSIVELIKSTAIIGVMIWIVYDTLKDQMMTMYSLYHMSLFSAIGYIGELVLDLGMNISIAMCFIGLADYIYQKFKFKKDLMMSKQEIKDEYKNSEGDPQVKGQIKRKMQQASQRRMMQSIPQADVVITNPTHFAIAIKYDAKSSSAPIVLAKGQDFLAAKIKEAAKENKIEIVENKPLARMLYANVEIGEEIPAELYQAVAEVLAYVYSLKNKETYSVG